MSKAGLVFVLVVTFTAGASFLRSGSPTAQPRQVPGTSQVGFADKENGKAAAETPLEVLLPGQRAMTVKAVTQRQPGKARKPGGHSLHHARSENAESHDEQDHNAKCAVLAVEPSKEPDHLLVTLAVTPWDSE